MYQAPVSGYFSQWNFSQQAGQQDYTREINPKFYLKNHDNVYGRIEVQIISDYNQGICVRIRYWLNPTGSRNLEYDPAKKIR